MKKIYRFNKTLAVWGTAALLLTAPLCNTMAANTDSTAIEAVADSMALADTIATDNADITPTEITDEESAGLHQVLKTKFIEGNASFMSLVALALVLGLAFCIERITA